MPGRLKLPDLSEPHKYEHQRPRRPAHLARRLTPPPARAEPPDLSLCLYAGLVLAMILLILAISYAVTFMITVIST